MHVRYLQHQFTEFSVVDPDRGFLMQRIKLGMSGLGRVHRLKLGLDAFSEVVPVFYFIIGSLPPHGSMILEEGACEFYMVIFWDRE